MIDLRNQIDLYRHLLCFYVERLGLPKDRNVTIAHGILSGKAVSYKQAINYLKNERPN